MDLKTLREKLETHKARSAWGNGVKTYAAEIGLTSRRALFQAESLLDNLATGRA